MKYRYLVLGALLAGMLAGCDTPGPSGPTPAKPSATPVTPSGAYWVTVRGYVRFVAYGLQDPHSNYSRVVLETEDHQVFTVVLTDTVPPVWTGMHGEFAYESEDARAGTWKNFVVKRRLDAETK